MPIFKHEGTETPIGEAHSHAYKNSEGDQEIFDIIFGSNMKGVMSRLLAASAIGWFLSNL